MQGRPWTIADRTGGQIDDVFNQLRGHLPGLIVQRLEVTYRADDDNVYFIGDQHQFDLIQVDTRPDGQRYSSSRTEGGTRRPTPPKR